MFSSFFRMRSLWIRMFIQQTLVILVVTAGFSAYMGYTISGIYRDQIGKRALAVSRAVARIPDIRAAFDEPNPVQTIQPIADSIRQTVGAEFVVVGNLQGIRYSHPLPDRLGHHMVGGDNGPALQGKEYVSIAKGSMGYSIRGKVPVRDDKGRIVGLVSTGYLLKDLDLAIWKIILHIAAVMALALVLGAGATYLLANKVKRQLFNLEPEQISTILEQREAILENSEDPIIAADRLGRVTLMNRAARVLLGRRDGHKESDSADDVDSLLPGLGASRVIQTGRSIAREPFVVGSRLTVATCVPVRVKGSVMGTVCTLRDRTEVQRLEMELSSSRYYTEALRAQRHQFQNQLHVISGLLSLGEVERAREYLDHQINTGQPWIDELRRCLDDPVLIGLLVAKWQLAAEAGVTLSLDPQTRQIGRLGSSSDLMTIIVGQLIDNAVEAAAQSPGLREVRAGVMTDHRGTWICVQDTGPGVDQEVWRRMWERGVSNKGKQRGMGLPLVAQAVCALGGSVHVQTCTAEGGVREAILPTQIGQGIPVSRTLEREISKEGVCTRLGQTGTMFTVFLPSSE